MRSTALAISILALLAGCAGPNDAMYPDINVADAAELLASDKDVVVLDIRTPGEYSNGHIPGAVMVDYKAADFAEQLKKLDRSKTYVMH